MLTQNTTNVTVESVKDTDLIVISNDQVLTTSLAVAEYFGKQHKNVMQTIEKSIANLTAAGQLKNQPSDYGFILGNYKNAQNKEQPLYKQLS